MFLAFVSLFVCPLLFLAIVFLALQVSRTSRFRNTSLLLLFTATLFLAGCSGTAPTSNAVALTSGNWQISSSSTQASQLPALSGSLTASGTNISGVLHADSPTGCITPGTAILVSGTANTQNAITLTGSNLRGGTLTITGTLAADGKSLTNAAYNVTGGICAFAHPTDATAQSFSNISGSYAGNFSDSDGDLIALTANLTQDPASDTTGNFQLSGTGTFTSNPCFSSPVSVSSSQVTGGSFTLTYADPHTTNSVTASGTFSTDGNTLTVTNWTLTGPCGPESGTGLLTRH